MPYNDSNTPVEILIADASVEQLDVLMAGLRENVEVKHVTPSDDAIAILAQSISRPNLDTLHVLGHGAPGEVILGGQTINTSSLSKLQEQLVSPSHNPSLIPQICLWSCRTGANASGETFMQTLADITQASVFATEELVGHRSEEHTSELQSH